MSDFLLDLATPGIRSLKPYQPGKPISELEREYGISDIIKLASNENPLGPPPAAKEAVRACIADLALYPDGNGFDLKQAISEMHGVDPACVTLGNGSNEVFVLLAEAFLAPGREAIHSQYAFIAFAIAVQCAGATARVAPACAADSFMPLGHDLRAMAARVNDRTAIVYIANPNNPTGTWLAADALREFIRSLPARVIVIVDEAYCDYVAEPDYPDAIAWLPEFPNLVVTRTFSKAYGLAGLRIGYGISAPEIANLLNRVRLPFNTSIPAQAAALAALTDSAHLQQSVTVNRQGLGALEQALRELEIGFVPSVGNFLLADVGRPAAPLYEALLRKGIIVRPVANYGLPNHLRISIGTLEENGRLIQALHEIKSSGAGAA